MKNQEQLLTMKEMREMAMGSGRAIEVLESVKEIITLGKTEFATTEKVAEYFEVTVDAIKKTVNRNLEELKDNGYEVVTGKQLSDIKSLCQIESRAKSMALFSKRVILNIGMLLRDSEVAKELRSRLLDIIHDADNGRGDIKVISEEISEEVALQKEVGEAFFNGNLEGLLVACTKITKLKDQRINELEVEKEILVSHSTTITESRQVINRLVRGIASKNKMSFGNVWSRLYEKVNYKLSINLKARKHKPLDSMSEKEMFETEIIARNWAEKAGLKVEEYLSLN